MVLVLLFHCIRYVYFIVKYTNIRAVRRYKLSYLTRPTHAAHGSMFALVESIKYFCSSEWGCVWSGQLPSFLAFGFFP